MATHLVNSTVEKETICSQGSPATSVCPG